MLDKLESVSCISFNCLGYKSSTAYIDDLCDKYDVCFISEHWLRPHKMPAVRSQWRSRQRWTLMKSSMDPEVIQKGRSHGGVGFICKEKDQISYRSIDVNSNRVCVIQLLSSQSVFLTIIWGLHAFL